MFPDIPMPFSARVNAHLDQAARNVVDWCRVMGLTAALPGSPSAAIWTEEQLVDFDLCQLPARTFPDVPGEVLDLASQWIVWGTYADDYFPRIYGTSRDMAGAKVFNARLALFMPLDAVSMPPPSNPVERGLADLWPRTALALSLEDRATFREIVLKTFASWLWELQNHIQQRIPDPIDYIEMRRRTFGSDLTMSLARITHSGDLPPEIFETRPMIGLEKAAQDYACFTNDVFSYQKEIQYEGELHNMVLVVQNFLGVEPAQAVLVVNDLMSSRMRQFEHIIDTELSFVADSFELGAADRGTLDGWVEMMKDWMAGILDWHRLSARYPEESLRALPVPGAVIHHGPGAVRTGDAPAVADADRLAAFAAAPSGPGTSAARLASRLSGPGERSLVG
jgi:germacradienol/geosmin synthase